MAETHAQLEFAELVEKHRGILFKVANNYCRNHQDRPDLIQEMILQLWRAFPSYKDSASYSTWMYGIALNVAISFYRRKRLHQDNSVSLESLDVELEAFDGATKQAPDDILVLNKMIRELDELPRALMLMYLDGFDHKAIAQVLGITPSNVATKIARLKENIRKEFELLDL